MRNKLLIAILTSVFLCVFMLDSIYAKKYNFKTLSVNDGLAQSVIFDVFQDSRGYIWFATDGGGVSKYDGRIFTNYNEKDGLSGNRVNCISEDLQGNIWFGTDGFGVCKFNGKTFVTISKKSGLSGNYIRDIELDDNGTIWVATDKGATLIKSYGDSLVLDVVGEKEGLTNNKILSITKSSTGEIWLGSENDGLFRSDGTYFSHFDYENGLKSSTIRVIEEDINGALWLGTSSGIVYFDINKESNNEEKFSYYNASNGFSDKKITSIIQDKSGIIWIGTYGDGVLSYKDGVVRQYTEKDGLSKNYILSMLEDFSGVIWFGTYAGGVTKFRGGTFQNISKKDGLSSNIVFSLLEDSKGNMWFGTYDGSITKFDGKNFYRYSVNDKYGDNNVFSIIEDFYGDIWYGTIYKGLSRLIYDSETDDYYDDEIINSIKFLKDIQVISLFRDKYGYLWIGTDKDGVIRVDVKRIAIDNAYLIYGVETGFPQSRINNFFEDNKGNIWFCTDRDGVYKIRKDELDAGRINFNLDRYTYEDGLSSNSVISITQDKNGNMWFGTRDNGICKFDGNTFYKYNVNDGISSDYVYLLTVDKKNNLWVGYEKGVDRIQLSKELKYSKQVSDIKSVKFFSSEDGFIGSECNGNAVTIDKSGRIWFGTVQGVNVYNPDLDDVDIVEPKTHISNIRLHYNETDWSNYSNKLTPWFFLPENVILGFDNNHLTFEFIGINYKNPGKIKYKYQLVGVDKGYSPESNITQITYSNLPPGTYKFKVLACNSDNVWNKEPTTFSFVILPPFYLSWWFIILCVVLLFVVVYLIIRNREKRLIEKNRELEHKVAERTLLLQEEKEEVERKKEIVEKQKEEIETKNSQIENQKTRLEEKNLAITDSIDYAKRIQQSIMPSDEYIKCLFPQSFVFYEPKDIVSGDFYWFNKRRNKVYFTTVDCTGHGVPGAIMSVISHNLIESAVIQEGIESPDEILNYIKRILPKKFSKSSEDSEIKDGMELALCCYDVENKTLEFSGAYHTAYLVKGYELIQLRGDKIAIDVTCNASGEFTKQKIEVEDGDMLYMFSDGYVDQIGGAKRKKFMIKKFREMVFEIHKLSMDNQKEYLRKRLFEWQGEYDRIDDVLVLGIRFGEQMSDNIDDL